MHDSAVDNRQAAYMDDDGEYDERQSPRPVGAPSGLVNRTHLCSPPAVNELRVKLRSARRHCRHRTVGYYSRISEWRSAALGHRTTRMALHRAWQAGTERFHRDFNSRLRD